ncbi:MAG: ADP-glyceromanno-heptose 6-epimerase [Marinilabiliales bacterium]
MIVVTGGAGFIGSNIISGLNQQNYKDIVIVDDFSNINKLPNYKNKTYTEIVHRNDFFKWLDNNHKFVQFIFHIGARTDTTEFNFDVLNELNLEYSKKIWQKCVIYGLPLIYASSAATYGDGTLGYSDNHNIINKLQPLNPYGISKNEFDKWVIKQEKTPWFWAGFKFFNVYGPNEYHKGRMSSVILHAYRQISETGKMKLFKSHNPDYNDGEQKRDFIFVDDVVDVLMYFMTLQKYSGIYNLGTGKARTFYDLANAIFKTLEINPVIEFIDTPEDIRDKYQYYTCADMQKLRSTGYNKEFTELEDGIEKYIKMYLKSNSYK